MPKFGVSVVLLASQTVAAAGNSGPITLPANLPDTIELWFNVTALTGTAPTVTFTASLIDPLSGLVAAISVGVPVISVVGETLVQLSNVLTAVAGKIGPLGSKIQISWTLGGTTPGATFAVNAEW
jgi:hypothetical protein